MPRRRTDARETPQEVRIFANRLFIPPLDLHRVRLVVQRERRAAGLRLGLRGGGPMFELGIRGVFFGRVQGVEASEHFLEIRALRMMPDEVFDHVIGRFQSVERDARFGKSDGRASIEGRGEALGIIQEFLEIFESRGVLILRQIAHGPRHTRRQRLSRTVAGFASARSFRAGSSCRASI